MRDAVLPIIWGCLLFVVININSTARAQYDNNYNRPDITSPVVKTEVHTIGKETRVRCNIKDRFRNIQKGLKITWEYKACKEGYAGACTARGLWIPLCGSVSQPCSPVLTLVEPNATDSGLYRCQMTLGSSIFTYNIYMLQFIEKKREPPQILAGLLGNVSVVAPLVAVLQCKVASTVPPTVRWFRRQEPTSISTSEITSTHNFIQYLNHTYQLLNCCPAVSLAQKDLYLSKLVISPSSAADSGFYICLAINNANYTYQQAYLQVLPAISNTRSAQKAEARSFLGLFMIPAALALIPTMAWVLCLRPRKVKSTDSERKLARTVGQQIVQSNGNSLVQTHTLSIDLPSHNV